VTAADSRAAQGLPPTVDDPDALAQIASILRNAQRSAAGDGGPKQDRKPGLASTRKGTPGPEVRRAA